MVAVAGAVVVDMVDMVFVVVVVVVVVAAVVVVVVVVVDKQLCTQPTLGSLGRR